MFDADQRARVATLFDDLVPGASSLGAIEYVETLLTALDYDPPRIWAGADADEPWIPIGPWERHAWALRIEEWRAVYTRVLEGTDDDDDRRVVYEHACEACYGDPAYGGNRDRAGWKRIAFPDPLFPPVRDA